MAVEEGTKARFSDGDKSSFSSQIEERDRCKWATKRLCRKSYLDIEGMPSGKPNKPDSSRWPTGLGHLEGKDDSVPIL